MQVISRPIGREIRPLVLISLLSVALAAPPAWAVSVRDSDPVEEASATVSRHLAALQAEQRLFSQQQAVEQARIQALASLANLRARETSLGYLSLDWLLSRNDPGLTGFIPIAGREGLLVSFDIPADDPLAFLRGRSYTYDNAVGAIALLLRGRTTQARRILQNLEDLTTAQGMLGFSYQVDSVFVDSTVRTGTLAWVGYAFALHERLTGDDRFTEAAEQIAQFLQGLQDSTGSLRGGPDVSWISTEHNIDAYFFFRELHRVTEEEEYQLTALQIRDSLLANHWDPIGRRFLRGIGDDTPALDVNVLGALFLKAVGRSAMARQALNFVQTTFRNQQTIPQSTVRIFGYSPDSERRTIWFEGTLMTALANHRAGRTRLANLILQQVRRLQLVWIRQNRWNGGFPYAMPRYVDLDGNTFAEFPSVASTAWTLITLASRTRTSPFFDAD